MDNSFFSVDHDRNEENRPPRVILREESAKRKGEELQFIDWEMVKKLCGIMCTQAEIAGILGISRMMLTDRVIIDGLAGSWKEFYEDSTAFGKMSLRRAQFDKAVNGKDSKMLIWLGKQHLGQADKTINITEDITDEMKKEYKLEDLDITELETMQGILEKVKNDEQNSQS